MWLPVLVSVCVCACALVCVCASTGVHSQVKTGVFFFHVTPVKEIMPGNSGMQDCPLAHPTTTVKCSHTHKEVHSPTQSINEGLSLEMNLCCCTVVIFKDQPDKWSPAISYLLQWVVSVGGLSLLYVSSMSMCELTCSQTRI